MFLLLLIIVLVLLFGGLGYGYRTYPTRGREFGGIGGIVLIIFVLWLLLGGGLSGLRY